MHWRYLVGMFVVGAIVGLFFWGCNSKTWNATWLNPSATAQSNPDWWSLPAFKLDKFDGTVAIVNDSSALYLRLFSRDHRLARRLEMSGLTVWLGDSQNKKSVQVGIRYPIGMRNRGESFRPDHFLPNADLAPEAMNDMIERHNDEFEILRGDSAIAGPTLRDDAAKFGINPVISHNPGEAFEYTLRISYGDLAPWIKPGSSILMKVESPAMDRSAFRGERTSEHGHGERPESGMGRPPDGGGFGGHGGRGGGGWGGRGEGRRDSTQQQSGGISPTSPIKLYFTVQLAATPTSGSSGATTK